MKNIKLKLTKKIIENQNNMDNLKNINNNNFHEEENAIYVIRELLLF